MINVIVSDICMILLTLLAAWTSGQPTLAFALGGGLLVCVTAGYIRDGEGKLQKIAQLFLAVLFALCTGSWWGCLIFACLLWPKAWQMALMMTGVLFVELIWFLVSGLREGMAGHDIGYLVASWLAMCFVVNLVGIIFETSRVLVRRHAEKEEEARRRIQSYSLGEMHEMQRSKELAKQSFYVDKNARLLERENISRNIHNSVGHSITAAIMTLDAADVLFEKKPAEAHKKMNDATERIRGSLSAIRSAVRALDEESGDVTVKDLTCYFDNILDEFLMDTDRTCDRIYELYEMEREIPREHAEFLTGALEELLTNGVKHGGAMHFMVKLSGDSAHLLLEVKDDGKSDFGESTREELIRKGFGLKKLTAYAQRCGGRTDFTNEEGFRSVIELPI